MKRHLIFKQAYYDAQPLDGRTNFSFFNETPDDDTSITSLTEAPSNHPQIIVSTASVVNSFQNVSLTEA